MKSIRFKELRNAKICGNGLFFQHYDNRLEVLRDPFPEI